MFKIASDLTLTSLPTHYVLRIVCICGVRVMVLTPLSIRCQLYRGDQFFWWRTPENPVKTTDLPQVNEKCYHINVVSSTPRYERDSNPQW